MVQETNKIKQHIEAERERLGNDLHEIEDRVRKATDLKEWFNRNPVATMGAALAGGFVLSMLIGKSSSPATTGGHYEPSRVSGLTRGSGMPASVGSELHSVGRTIDRVFAALIGVGSRKLRDAVAEAVPGFRDKYDELERKSELS